MTEHPFFDPPPVAEKWDGEAKLSFTPSELYVLYSGTGQWHGTAVGPKIPFSDGVRCTLDIAAIFFETREEALDVMRWHIHAACNREGMACDLDQWTIMVELLNGC